MKKWWILPLAAVMAVAGIGLAKSNRRETVAVRTAVLKPQSVEQTISCSGVVEAGELRPIPVMASCVLSEVSAREGQAVREGDVLACVDKQASRAYAAQSAGGAAQVLALAAASDTVTAPSAGILASVNASSGEHLSMGEPLAMLAPINGLQVRVAIREKNLPRLQVGQKVHIRGDGFEKAVYEGELIRISSAGRQTAAGDTVVEGIVSLNEGQADESLRLGLTAQAQIVTATVSEGLLLPYMAIQEDENGQEYVYLLKDGQAVRHTITSQAELSKGVLTDDAALFGSTLILEPQKVQDGTVVYAAGEDTP